MNARERIEVTVTRILAGYTFDHTGTRQSNLYVLRGSDGEAYLFDSFADWSVGDVRKVSAQVAAEPSTLGSVTGRFIQRPCPVKTV